MELVGVYKVEFRLGILESHYRFEKGYTFITPVQRPLASVSFQISKIEFQDRGHSLSLFFCDVLMFIVGFCLMHSADGAS